MNIFDLRNRLIQDYALFVSSFVNIRDFPLESGRGYADYLLFVNGEAVGALEHRIRATIGEPPK